MYPSSPFLSLSCFAIWLQLLFYLEVVTSSSNMVNQSTPKASADQWSATQLNVIDVDNCFGISGSILMKFMTTVDYQCLTTKLEALCHYAWTRTKHTIATRTKLLSNAWRTQESMCLTFVLLTSSKDGILNDRFNMKLVSFGHMLRWRRHHSNAKVPDVCPVRLLCRDPYLNRNWKSWCGMVWSCWTMN